MPPESRLKLVRPQNSVSVAKDDIVPMEFKAIKAILSVPRPERLKRVRQQADAVRMGTEIATEILSRDRQELVSWVRQGEEVEMSRCLSALVDVRETTQMLLELIGAAQARLTVALARDEARDHTPAA